MEDSYWECFDRRGMKHKLAPSLCKIEFRGQFRGEKKPPNTRLIPPSRSNVLFQVTQVQVSSLYLYSTSIFVSRTAIRRTTYEDDVPIRKFDDSKLYKDKTRLNCLWSFVLAIYTQNVVLSALGVVHGVSVLQFRA